MIVKCVVTQYMEIVR